MSSITELPTEILLAILRNLGSRQLVRCRRVCARWRDVVDLLVDEKFWQRLCQRHYPSIYLEARYKCDPTLAWHELYKSLHLWFKLKKVDEENWKQVCSYPEKDIGVCTVSAIHGRICVHEVYKMLYYNLKGEMTGEFNTEWEQLDFRETEHIIVFQTNVVCRWMPRSELTIIKKTNGKPDLDSKVIIGNILLFAVVGKDVYYDCFTPRDQYGNRDTLIQIFVCRARDNYKSTLIGEMDSEIIAFGCTNDTLNIILYTNEVYVFENNKFVKKNVEFKSTLYIMKTYNFLYDGGELLYGMSGEVGFTITAFYFYGDFTFLGGTDGILRLYNTNKLLNCPTTKPLCRFDLARRLKPKNTFCARISGIDVIEKENGHIIVVSISKGAYLIELNHSQNRRSARIKKRKLKLFKSVKTKTGNKRRKCGSGLENRPLSRR